MNEDLFITLDSIISTLNTVINLINDIMLILEQIMQTVEILVNQESKDPWEKLNFIKKLLSDIQKRKKFNEVRLIVVNKQIIEKIEYSRCTEEIAKREEIYADIDYCNHLINHYIIILSKFAI